MKSKYVRKKYNQDKKSCYSSKDIKRKPNVESIKGIKKWT